MKTSAAQIIEAVRYIEGSGTDAGFELEALVEKVKRTLQVSCTVVRLDMLPEIAEALEADIGYVDFVLLSDIDNALSKMGATYSVPDYVEIVLLQRYWLERDPVRVAALYQKYGYDLCFYAVQQEIGFGEVEGFDKHFTITRSNLDQLKRLPLKMYQVVGLLEDGLTVNQVISLTNDLRSSGLRGLVDRVRAASEGHPKPLLDGAI